jgi:hypothetical protein
MKFTDAKSPRGIRVTQPAAGLAWAYLIYPDQPSFLRDGRSFVFHSSEGPQVCYPGARTRTRKLFKDAKGRPLVVTFDGRYAYYAEYGDKKGGSMTLFRKDLETFRSETLFRAEGKLPGVKLAASKFHPATVSSDNRRVAAGMFLGDGKTKDAPFGLVVLDLDRGEARVAAEDRDFFNMHLQYCRSAEPGAEHDLLVQMNHGSHTDETGKVLCGLGPPSEKGVDIHVVRDDGTDWRDLPWGRDGRESLIGHQIWRGATRAAATVTLENLDTSYGWADGSRQEVVAGWPVKAPRNAHRGLLTPGGKRVFLSKGYKHGRFCHLCCDSSGLKFVFDTFPVFDGERAGMQIFIGSARNADSPLKFKYILNTRITFGAEAGYHAHPILSPDGTRLLFNSRASGAKQFYMVTDFEY